MSHQGLCLTKINSSKWGWVMQGASRTVRIKCSTWWVRMLGDKSMGMRMEGARMVCPPTVRVYQFIIGIVLFLIHKSNNMLNICPFLIIMLATLLRDQVVLEGRLPLTRDREEFHQVSISFNQIRLNNNRIQEEDLISQFRMAVFTRRQTFLP